MKPLSICRSHPKPPLPQAQRFLRCLTATLLLLAASAAGCRTKPSALPSLYDNEVRQSLAAGKAEFLNGNAADARTHFFQALSRSIQRDDVVGILQSYVNLISTDIREDELANARLLLTDARFAEESFALDRVAPHRVGPLNEVRFELAWIDAYLKLNTQDYPAVDAALEQAGRQRRPP